MDSYVYLKPGEILYVVFKGRPARWYNQPTEQLRTRTYETERKVVVMDGGLIIGNPRRLSPKEVRDLTSNGAKSLIEGFKAKKEGIWKL